MMTPKLYHKLVVAFEPDNSVVSERMGESERNARLMHSVIGISGEAGELADAVKKVVIYGQDLNVANVKEECGDLLWYLTLTLEAVGSSFEEVMEMNIKKLSKRYPKGFSEKHAKLRLDKEEGK